jgi:hypothetical protein
VSFLFLFRSILRVFNEITYRERGRRAEYSDGMTSLHIAEEKKLIKRKREINQTKRNDEELRGGWHTKEETGRGFLISRHLNPLLLLWVSKRVIGHV